MSNKFGVLGVKFIDEFLYWNRFELYDIEVDFNEIVNLVLDLNYKEILGGL